MGFLSDREELVDVVHAASRTNVPVEHPVHVDVVKQGHGNRTSESGQSVFTGGMVNPDGLQTPVGGWLIIGDYTIHILVQCGAPQWCLLVYKPHEYYSYIYHKPQWNWSYVNPNLAFTNWGTTLWLSQSMNGEFRYQMTKAAVPIATYPSTVCGSAWLGLLGYESKLSPRIRWLTHLNTRNIIKYLRKKRNSVVPWVFCGSLGAPGLGHSRSHSQLSRLDAATQRLDVELDEFEKPDCFSCHCFIESMKYNKTHHIYIYVLLICIIHTHVTDGCHWKMLHFQD